MFLFQCLIFRNKTERHIHFLSSGHHVFFLTSLPMQSPQALLPTTVKQSVQVWESVCVLCERCMVHGAWCMVHGACAAVLQKRSYMYAVSSVQRDEVCLCVSKQYENPYVVAIRQSILEEQYFHCKASTHTHTHTHTHSCFPELLLLAVDFHHVSDSG